MNKRKSLQSIKTFIEDHPSPLIVILGATATGKSKYGINLAKEINGEIISADSRQIYIYMDIGTAKLNKKEMEGIPHYLINRVYPDEDYSVSRFQKDGEMHIENIQNMGKVPIMVGGTGMYIESIVYNYELAEKVKNDELRKKLSERFEKEGGTLLHAELSRLDPHAAKKIHPHNRHHLIRALEIIKSTGKSKFEESGKNPCKYQCLLLGLHKEKDDIYKKINERVVDMFEEGLVEETQRLLDMGYQKDIPSMTSIGYKEVIDFLSGNITKEEAMETMQKRTRHYAKRQMTWFKRMKEIEWITHS